MVRPTRYFVPSVEKTGFLPFQEAQFYSYVHLSIVLAIGGIAGVAQSVHAMAGIGAGRYRIRGSIPGSGNTFISCQNPVHRLWGPSNSIQWAPGTHSPEVTRPMLGMSGVMPPLSVPLQT